MKFCTNFKRKIPPGINKIDFNITDTSSLLIFFYSTCIPCQILITQNNNIIMLKVLNTKRQILNYLPDRKNMSSVR